MAPTSSGNGDGEVDKRAYGGSAEVYLPVRIIIFFEWVSERCVFEC